MASPEQIQKIKSLAKNGESVNKIKEKLEIPKSTVYYHFKKEVGQKQKEKTLKIPEDEEINENYAEYSLATEISIMKRKITNIE